MTQSIPSAGFPVPVSARVRRRAAPRRPATAQSSPGRPGWTLIGVHLLPTKSSPVDPPRVAPVTIRPAVLRRYILMSLYKVPRVQIPAPFPFFFHLLFRGRCGGGGGGGGVAVCKPRERKRRKYRIVVTAIETASARGSHSCSGPRGGQRALRREPQATMRRAVASACPGLPALDDFGVPACSFRTTKVLSKSISSARRATTAGQSAEQAEPGKRRAMASRRTGILVGAPLRAAG